jgi:hypothetical protein
MERNDLTKLAKLVAKDVAAGQPGDNSLAASRLLEASPEAALGLIELLLAEGRRKRPNQKLISACVFLFGQALEYLRYGVEAGHGEARSLVDAVSAKLLTAGRAGEMEPALLLLLLSEFATAKLEPGEELRTLMIELLEQNADQALAAADTGQMAEFAADLAKSVKGDVFALHAHLTETGAAFPEDHRGAMAALLLQSGEPAAREAAVGWLLDPSPDVRASVAGSLVEAALRGLVTPIMLRRMIAVRNWLPETGGGRSALDQAIQACRRKGVDCASWPEAQLRDVLASGIDGSGAVGILVICREGRRHALASLLLKHGIGVRDAWAQHGMARAEADGILLQAGGSVGQYAVDREFLRTAVAHFLAVSLETGILPPFGLVDFLETVGLPSFQPELLPTETLLAMLEQGIDPEARTAAVLDGLLREGADLADEYPFLDSWFEDGDQVQALLGGKRLSRARREAVVLEQVLEPRRRRWADLLAWTAFLLSRSDEDERWLDFYAAARALVEGRGVGDVPILRYVAGQTVEAQKHRQRWL